MTVVETGRISMADMNTRSLDDLFERFEHMPVPEGYKVEVVGGSAFMSPQRETHREITLDIIEQLRPEHLTRSGSPRTGRNRPKPVPTGRAGPGGTGTGTGPDT